MRKVNNWKSVVIIYLFTTEKLQFWQNTLLTAPCNTQMWFFAVINLISQKTFHLLTPKSNQHIYKHQWSKFGEIPFIGLWDMVFTRFRDTQTQYSFTHSQTDRAETKMPRAPFFNSGRSRKTSIYI